jgi:glycosyltransferase involved in cell wall biosynthesis
MADKPRILATNRKEKNAIWCEVADFLPGWDEEAARRWRKPAANSLWFNLWWAIKLFMASRNYEVVATGSDRMSLLFAFLQGLLRRKRKHHILLFAFWNLPERGFKRVLRKVEYRLLLGWVSKLIVFGRRQQQLYSMALGEPIEKFAVVPFHTNIGDIECVVDEGDYIFTGGDTARDYPTLIKAIDGLPYKVIIASVFKRHFDGIKIPSNVSIVSVEHGGFVRLMSGAKAVVLPLQGGLLQAGGQQTFLNAMYFGKAVVVVDDNSADEYIANGIDGVVVAPGDVKSLRNAIVNLMENDKYRREIGQNAKKKALEYSRDRFVLGVLKVIEDLCGEKI